MTKKSLFLKLACPDKTGLSRKVYLKEFKGEYEALKYRNGNPWARSVEKDYQIYIDKIKGKTNYIQLRGLSKHSYNSSIKKSIRTKISSKRCVVLYTNSQIECDHKDGFKNFDISIEHQTENLFQPMHKSVNDAKRSHCKKCKDTRIRFDAKQLGYKKSQSTGNTRYEGTCVGCYWYDPFEFNGK